MMAVTVPREDEWHLYSSGREQTNSTSLLKEFSAVLSEKGSPGLAKTHEPVVVDLRPGATPVRQRPYPYHGRHTWEFGTTSNTDAMLKF